MDILELIKKALNIAGYTEDEPTKENLIGCYLDYADSYGGDIEELAEDIKSGEITINHMCRALIRA
jgi:hypothetical protein